MTNSLTITEEMEMGYVEENSSKMNLPLEEHETQEEGGRAMVNLMDGEQAVESNLDAGVTPTVGMEFESEKEAYAFYNSYANQVGFGTRIRQNKKSKRFGHCVFLHVCCSKEGFKKTDGMASSQRPNMRCGCTAGLKIRLQMSGKWKAIEVNLQHNHLVSPSKSQYIRSHKQLHGVKKRLELGVKTGQRVHKTFHEYVTDAGGHAHLTFGERDCQNYVTRVRQLELHQGDTEAMHKFLCNMQSRDSNFFYVIDHDDEGHLRNVFWTDGRSRVAYEYFGDVVTFDTTYLTNKYNLKFAPFVGVNHHGQSVLLGCGLLEGETIESFVWLFKTLLVAMSGRAPNAIITDQSEAIQVAVAEVFPQSRHRLCLWHIMKKIPEKFAKFTDYEAIKFCFKRIVYDSLKIDEFEHRWKEMVQKYKLECNKWLITLYSLREKWVPVFLRDTFWAGMSTTQHSESMDVFFDKYVNSRTCLKEFVEQYELTLREKYEKESLAEISNFNSQPVLSIHHNFEIQLAPIYTSDIFKKFQEEIMGALCRCYNITTLRVDGVITTYVVKERIFNENGDQLEPKEFEVLYNTREVEVTCICCLFQFKGFLCRHALYTLNHSGVEKIPPKYIISRWRKDFKRKHSLDYGYSNLSIDNPIHRYDILYRKATQLVEEGAISEKGCFIALQLLQEGLEKIRIANNCSDGGSNQHSTFVGINNEVDICASGRVLDPNIQKRVGRPRKNGLVSEGEQAIKSKQKKMRTIMGSSNTSNSHVISRPFISLQTPDLLNNFPIQESIQ